MVSIIFAILFELYSAFIPHFLCLIRMMFPRDTLKLVLVNQELEWNMIMGAVLHSMVMLMVIG